MIKKNQKYLTLLRIFCDVVCILLSLLFSYFIRFKSGLFYVEDIQNIKFTYYLIPILFIIPIYLLSYFLFKLYGKNIYNKSLTQSINIFKANCLGIFIFVMVLYIFKVVDYSRYLLLIFAVSNIICTILCRSFLNLYFNDIMKKERNLKKIIIIGNNNISVEFLKGLDINKCWRYKVLAILDEDIYENNDKNIYESKEEDIYENKEEDIYENEHVYGNKEIYVSKNMYNNKCISSDKDIQPNKDKTAKVKLEVNVKSNVNTDEIPNKTINEVNNKNKYALDYLDKLEYYLESYNIEEVFIALTLNQYGLLESVVNLCEKSGVKTNIIPDYYKIIPAKPYVEEINGLPIINIRYIPLDDAINKIIKRIVDILGSVIAIILFSPIMLITAIITKMNSKGPVIFKQQRVGLNKKTFVMYKFRSMIMENTEVEKTKWTSKVDTRITSFGTFIRKTSIDELPQLFNVLKGDMSLVGPRPERPYFVGKFKEKIPKYMIKHQVRPGMTGWAQVNGYRGDTSIIKRIEHDIYYIENWSIGLDVKILFFTIFKGFINKNAY